MRVKYLKLEISDTIPMEINSLEFIEELYLKGRFKECDLDFSKLPHLKYLSLQSEELQVFPTEALRSPQLQNLKVIQGLFTKLELPLEILSPLRSLTIKNTLLAVLPLELGQLHQLIELNLTGNKLTKLTPSFKELVQLTRLNIDHNCFKKLDNIVKECPSLKHLSCDGNLFSEEEKFRIQREFNLFPH